jgi:hypothetical protein
MQKSGSDRERRFCRTYLISDSPGQQLRNAIDRMVSDAPNDATQVGFRIDAIEFGRTDQAVNRSSALTARIRTGK